MAWSPLAAAFFSLYHARMNLDEYKDCRLCPRQCGVNRLDGKKGYCRETAVCRIASVGPHFGEEPSFSGQKGSGTFFFSGCSSRCLFCQNYQISIENKGYEFSEDQLLQAALSLIEQGGHNLNFVTPDHFWPHIRNLCETLRARGETIPFLWNSSGYQEPSLIEDYARHIDIFLPDFKFADPKLAETCMHDRRYPEIAMASLRKMVELKGFLTPWDPTGRQTAWQGVLVRHLVMPGCVDNSLQVLRLLATEFGRLLPLSIMSQFEPIPNCEKCRLFTTRVSSKDYQRVCDEVETLGFKHVYIQPDMGDMAFMPDFDREQPFDGNQPSL
jgi:putative pyruvate formate lyase activating enzyme